MADETRHAQGVRARPAPSREINSLIPVIEIKRPKKAGT
jgi:hypothetical protein